MSRQNLQAPQFPYHFMPQSHNGAACYEPPHSQANAHLSNGFHTPAAAHPQHQQQQSPPQQGSFAQQQQQQQQEAGAQQQQQEAGN